MSRPVRNTLRSAPSLRHILALATLGVLAAVAAVTIAGCSDDDNPAGSNGTPTPTTTTVTGFFVNGTESGTITLVISSTTLAPPLRAQPASSDLVPGMRLHRAPTVVIGVAGTLKPSGGSPIALIGQYDTEADTVRVTGGGYEFRGEYEASSNTPNISGQYTGPNGPGGFGCVTGEGHPVTLYCGNAASEVTPATARWLLATYSSKVGGIAWGDGADEGLGFEGTLAGTGTTRSITFFGGDPGVQELNGTGTLNTVTQTVSGKWRFDDFVAAETDSGTWSGALCP